jgi:membrane protease YdiL (CAAX protease family)
MNRNPVFINNYGRLRSGWRFAIFVLLFIVMGIFLGFAIQLISLTTPILGTRSFLFLNSFFSLAAALLLGWICGKLLDGVPFFALGASNTSMWFTHFVEGIILGAISLLLAIGIAIATAGYRFQFDSTAQPNSISRSLLTSLIVFAVAAAFEEALFRGYILQTFARANLSWLAIAITAVFFGIVHAGNPGANVISTLNTALAGVWFGIAYLKTRDLWFPFGIHFMWNWMQGSIFGIEVSGLTNISPYPLFREVDNGPGWITGADYGIEAGIATTSAILISIALIYVLPFPRASEDLVELTSKEVPLRSIGS